MPERGDLRTRLPGQANAGGGRQGVPQNQRRDESGRLQALRGDRGGGGYVRVVCGVGISFPFGGLAPVYCKLEEQGTH